MGNIQRKEFDTTEMPAVNNPDWMASLDDGRLLSDLSIPGTHRSMSLFGGNQSNFQCQSWKLSSQFEAGIRFVDIRCRHFYNKLAVHHGEKFLYCHFNQILYDAIAFLRDHSKEFIFIHLMEEYEASNNTGTFSDLVCNYMKDVGKEWFWESSDIPTIGQVRGKMILLQDFEGPAVGIPYKGLSVVKELHVPALTDVDQKWSTIEESLKSAENGNSNQLYLTYCAGESEEVLPMQLAEKINHNLSNFLEDKGEKQTRLGIIALDFPGAELVHQILSNN